MSALMTDHYAGENLSTLLLPMVSDPGKRDFLHEVLGPYCHQGRNHLNSLKLSLYLAKASEPDGCRALWSDLENKYQHVERLFDQLQMIYRPLRLNLVRLPLSLLFEDARECWSERMEQSGRTLVLVPPAGGDVGDFDPLQLRGALDGFVAWRAGLGRAAGEAGVHWRAENGHFVVAWHEATAAATDPAKHAGMGFGELARPVLARVVTAHRGALEIAAHGGFHLTLRWPLRCDIPCESP